jgi:hypothetical protein
MYQLTGKINDVSNLYVYKKCSLFAIFYFSILFIYFSQGLCKYVPPQPFEAPLATIIHRVITKTVTRIYGTEKQNKAIQNEDDSIVRDQHKKKK